MHDIVDRRLLWLASCSLNGGLTSRRFETSNGKWSGFRRLSASAGRAVFSRSACERFGRQNPKSKLFLPCNRRTFALQSATKSPGLHPRDSGPTWMPKKPNKKKLRIKLVDLTPKKDARGGHASYSSDAPLSIPPPGFISAHGRTPDGHR